jgi:hypothetical protein
VVSSWHRCACMGLLACACQLGNSPSEAAGDQYSDNFTQLFKPADIKLDTLEHCMRCSSTQPWKYLRALQSPRRCAPFSSGRWPTAKASSASTPTPARFVMCSAYMPANQLWSWTQPAAPQSCGGRVMGTSVGSQCCMVKGTECSADHVVCAPA